MLDFQKVKLTERDEAKKIFAGKEAEAIKMELNEAAAKMGTDFEESKRKQERIVMLQVSGFFFFKRNVTREKCS